VSSAPSGGPAGAGGGPERAPTAADLWKSRVYAGIGARQTPGPFLAQIEELGARLARLGWTLRTGMSPGADQAFYRGALGAGGDVELYLPCPDFQAQARLADERGRVRVSERPTSAAVALAERFYVAAAGEAWATLGDCARALLARDAHQVLGRDLDSPVRFVVCWTPAGDRDGRDPRSGGTGQALRVAAARSLPVFNIANPADLAAVTRVGVA